MKKDMKPDRYLAIRVRPWQTELFSDGNSYHYYAVVTNRWRWRGRSCCVGSASAVEVWRRSMT